MRPIKFRAKDENGKWCYGSLLINYYDRICDSIVSADIEGTDIYNVGERRLESTLVNYDTIGQFTGLCDSKGKGIYEGDIVKWGGTMYVVIFWYGMFYASAELCNKGAIGGFPLHRLTEYGDAECIIVGNIHDNPELMKGGDESKRIIDFGGWGFIERDLTPINRKIVLSKDYANKEPQVMTFKIDFSKKGELK